MFKFFRQYNKIILVVGGVILMIAFLVPQAAQMFAPTGANSKAGYVNGQAVRQGDLMQAAHEIQLLQTLPLNAGMVTSDDVAWALLQADAAEMGLWVSEAEINTVLGRLGIDAERMSELATQHKTTTATIRHVVRRFLIAEDYRRLVDGVAYTDPGDASPSAGLRRVEMVYQALEQVGGNVDMYQRFLAPQIAMQSSGAFRVSTPLLRRTVRDNASSLSGRMVVLRPDPASVPAPTDAQLDEVFNTYRDNLPGAGKPFPFGYRYPDRVRGRYLSVSGEAIRAAVNVPYLDVKNYYLANPAEFADDEGNTPERPTAEARRQITQQLTDRGAQALADRVQAFVAGKVAESIRGFEGRRGYYTLPADHQPMDLDALATQVKDAFDVEATVAGDPQAWATVADLSNAPGIGRSAVDSEGRIGFAAYVSQVRELAEVPDDVTASMRTQVGLPGRPLRGFDGGVYLHLLSEVSPSHAPADLAEVRDRVEQDARTIAAYQTLAAKTDALLAAAVEKGVDAVAGEHDAVAIDVPDFQRVAGLDGSPPLVPEVGANADFAAAAFALVEDLDAAENLQDLPADQRTIALALHDAGGSPGVALFRAQSYEPLTDSDYAREVEVFAPVGVSLLLRGAGDQPPVSVEAISQRTGFDLEEYRN